MVKSKDKLAFCATETCGVAVVKGDNHAYCFTHRLCNKANPCPLCVDLTPEEWKVTERRLASLTRRRVHESNLRRVKNDKSKRPAAALGTAPLESVLSDFNSDSNMTEFKTTDQDGPGDRPTGGPGDRPTGQPDF